MIKILDNVYIGNEDDCFYDNKSDWAVIHACKHPCHQNAVGYMGSLSSNHPNYLIFQRECHLFLNLVDMNTPLSHKYTEPIISAALKFIENYITSKNILIHCNVGQSRLPMLALLYLAKRKASLPNESYSAAKKEFLKIYSAYLPGSGVENYL